MIVWITLGIALQAIARNAMRSFLTALGVVIGVAAVIVMVHLGESATQQVRAQIASLGQNLLIVHPGAGGRGPGGARTSAAPFEVADVEAVAAEVPGVQVAPVANAPALAVVGNANWPTTVTGTTNAFFDVRDWPLASGRRFEPAELRSAAPVCVIGETVRQELLPGEDAVGATLRLGRVSCRVAGVLTSKQSLMGSDPDDVVLMPLRTVQRRLAGTDDVQMMYVAAEEGTTAQAQADIERLLRERRRLAPGESDDFRVRDMKEIAARVEGSTATMTALLGAVAAVSLLVGGIGIMNIMLVSVTERTREIGIRMAVGARGREVLLQFLVESAVLSTLGGLFGVALGLGGSYLATRQLEMPFVVVPHIMVVAFLFSAAVGVVFGYLPARKASRLNPIDALRHE